MLNYYEIRQKCLTSRKLYNDPEFPPSEKILMLERKQTIQWCRPRDICVNPKFVVDGFSRFDVMQGGLGDCWFLAALATLTQNKKLFEKVVPVDNDFEKNYAGVFHFRFWKDGQWIEVIIDDLLPVCQGKLVFIKSPKSEFWAALLEKAYAKLYGSYGAIEGGNSSEAMIDFTGGVLERFSVNETEPTILFKIVKKAYERGSLIATSIHEGDKLKGLIGRHAYTITKAHDIKMNNQSLMILGIRNPWGDDTEWNGAFGDKSREWSKISKEIISQLDLKFEDDGEFHMTFDDFSKYFNMVDICHWSPGSLELSDYSKKWSEDVHHGRWQRGSFVNSQIIIKLVDPDEDDDDDLCTLILSFLTKNRRRMRLNSLSVQIEVFKLKASDVKHDVLKRDILSEKNKVAKTKHQPYRDITSRFKLPPGYYAIVPSKTSYEEGEFMLRVITEFSPKQKKVIVKVNEVARQSKELFQQSSFEVYEPPQSNSAPLRRNEFITFIAIFMGLLTLLAIVFILLFILMLILEPLKVKKIFNHFLF